MDDYAKLGGVKADTRVKVARGGIGMAMRKEATPPDISSPDAFKKALTQATSIAMTDTAMPNGSGILTQSILTNAGVMDAMREWLPSASHVFWRPNDLRSFEDRQAFETSS
jgi:hypothetical protein